MPSTAPYGAWTSPLAPAALAGGSIGVSEPQWCEGALTWLESRPQEGGRIAVMRQRDGAAEAEEALPAPWSARSAVHEYGGGAYLATPRGLIFVHAADQRLYLCRDGAVTPLSGEGPWRYADFALDAGRNRVICVGERHGEGHEPENCLVAVSLDGSGAMAVLDRGRDFYAAPRLSPDGTKLAWLAWDHPDMPWDGCDLMQAAVTAEGGLAEPARVAGGRGESIFQPDWSPTGVLTFVSDRSGWWNLYRLEGGQPQPLHPMEAEFGLPAWVFGRSSWAYVGPSQIVCAYGALGVWRLARLDTATAQFTPFDLPYSGFDYVVPAGPGRIACIAAGPRRTGAVVTVDAAGGGAAEIRRPMSGLLDERYIALGEPVAFPTGEGEIAYAFYYAPTNPDFVAPAGDKPPLIVMSHGGPTAAAGGELSLKKQFWTSRGFAVLDVNYRGSTGYGTAYRRRLDGQWGVYDMEDCCAAARWAVAQGRADPERLIITGGSAGGYTTLCALTFRDVFKAGASYYGIGDLKALAADTHKFESRYLDRLLGPDAERVYAERSPIHHVDRLSCPVILFQGREDKAVPPNQAEAMAAALRAKGMPVALLMFDGEGHGFRRAETIARCYEAELAFYRRVFRIPAAETLPPLLIENLPA
ncbi:MAG TPA: prolyl oligopeptidase family serine peptidase [Alphaproteobacteria bacterium]|nr:prolyl oligopeptidase family serine peptidase [Alphaproteobacteria bacterium]